MTVVFRHKKTTGGWIRRQGMGKFDKKNGTDKTRQLLDGNSSGVSANMDSRRNPARGGTVGREHEPSVLFSPHEGLKDEVRI